MVNAFVGNPTEMVVAVVCIPEYAAASGSLHLAGLLEKSSPSTLVKPMRMTASQTFTGLRLTVLCGLCLLLFTAQGASGQHSGNVVLRVDQPVAISFGDVTLYGVLTLPASEGPHPGIAIITGSAGPDGRAGASARTHIDHAHKFAAQGFACLRYDPPGVGRSTGERGLDSLEARAGEALAVARFLQQQPDIEANRVGLWGVSQGGWVIAMAASESPQAIAFLIMVSGTTVSVAEQQVFGVEMQSRAAGIVGDDLVKAVLVCRLLIDWQVPSPIFETPNRGDLLTLGDGLWAELARIVYGSDVRTMDEELAQVIAILEAMDRQPWAASLYLGDLYVPNLRSIPPGSGTDLIDAVAESLLASPASYFRLVECPTLAVFGEDDVHVPVERSVALLRDHFQASGNEDLTVVVFPDAGHSLNGFMPSYWEAVYSWLEALRERWAADND